MIEFIVGDYSLKEDDILVSSFTLNVIYKNEYNQDKTFVLYAEELKLDKEKIQFIIENATSNLKIITVDTKPTKGLRAKTKAYTLDKHNYEETLSPFDLAKIFVTERDRDKVLDLLITNKPSLWLPIKALIGNQKQLCTENVKNIAFLDTYQWKCNQEILYYFIAYKLKIENYIKYLNWPWPKKKEEIK